ncbi:MAG: YidC/Oxa1 family membrane protein insertase [Atribacterota bacterium]|nr:YidC/Oxa1 family membrane protein insertase [Atribacterota bacterium]
MALYKEHKVNPMGGCLPLLIKMPILILLFQVLRKFEYLDSAGKIAGGFLWIPRQVEIIVGGIPKFVAGLAAPDQLVPLPGNGIFGIQYLEIMPLLVADSMYLQQKMTSPSGAVAGKDDGSAEQPQKMMTIMVPLMIGFMSFSQPSGLTLYWFTSTLLGIGQQYLINKQVSTIVEIPKEFISDIKEKSANKKPNKPVIFKEEPWIPGYEGTEGETYSGGKGKAKKYKKGKKKIN